MIKNKKGLLAIFSLPLASCSGSFSLFDQSIFFDGFNKEEHYRIVNGEKRGASAHVFDKLVEVGIEDGSRRLYDYECRCGYRMNYDMLVFEESEDEAALSGIDFHATGYSGTNDVTYQSRRLYSLYGCPNKYNGKPVTAVNAKAFAFKGYDKPIEVTADIFPSSISTIKKNAFTESSFHFEELNLPYVTTIEDDAFYKDNVTKIVLGDKLTSLGSAFHQSNLTSFTLLPGPLEKIPEYCFYYASSLEEVNLPSSIKRIGDRAFCYCPSLKDIVWPDGLEEVDDEAYFGCTSIESVVVPTSMKKLGANLFSYVDKEAHTHAYPKSFKCFYYKGNEEEATRLFGDLSKMSAKVALYSEDEPTKEGDYWHYVEGKPTLYGEEA